MAPSVAIIGTRGYPSYYGGFETAVRQLAPYLADEGWDVTVYGRPGATKSDQPATHPQVRTRVTKGFETKSLSTLSFGFTSTVDAAVRKPDVALVMNVANGFWLPSLKLRGIPTLVNVDGIEWERAKWGRAAKATFRTGARLTARFATGIVGDSHEIVRRWSSEFGRDGTFIPYGGTVPSELDLVDGLQHREYVLIVARFVPENTILEFFDAAARIANHLPVVIVGSTGYGGELDKAAEDLAAGHPNVRWLGHVSDDARLFSLWRHSAAYFHGHSVGGTNPALVQAMACGAVTVARDTVYNREVLGDAGVFVAPDGDSIYEGIMSVARLSEAEANEMARKSMKRVDETYNWDLVCRAYKDNLLDLINDKSRSKIASREH